MPLHLTIAPHKTTRGGDLEQNWPKALKLKRRCIKMIKKMMNEDEDHRNRHHHPKC